MKKFDISRHVMREVANFEQKRSSFWLRALFIILAILGFVSGLFIWVSIQTLNELQSWDLLTVFAQDWEIIGDYWQEVVGTFLEEVPSDTVLIGVAVLVMFVMIFVVTRKRRKIMQHRLRELAKKSHLRENN